MAPRAGDPTPDARATPRSVRSVADADAIATITARERIRDADPFAALDRASAISGPPGRPPPWRVATFTVPIAQPPPPPTPTLVLIPQLSPTGGAVRGWIEGTLLALDVPIRSQLDGSEYQASNCGPTSIAMVLDAFGVVVPTSKLRNLANLLQGTYDRETGIALDHLAEIATEAGLRPLGLRDALGYRGWSIADLRDQVRRGHPVVTLVKMRELPDHAGAATDTDHYVVVVGFDGVNLLINDPALPGDRGFRRPVPPEQLERAWAASSIPRQAVAIASGPGVPELSFPDPLLPAGAPTPRPLPGMVLPALPPVAPAVVGADVPAAPPGQPARLAEPAAPGAPIVIVLTPAPQSAAPQVIVVQVPMPIMPTAVPVPLRDRWERPPGHEPLLMPAPRDCGALGPRSSWAARMPGESDCEALVLGTSATLPTDVPWRSIILIGELFAGIAIVRWAFK